ncbi:MAG TPA: hypothetical protein VF953_01070, partial [Terriglobales bacterium]
VKMKELCSECQIAVAEGGVEGTRRSASLNRLRKNSFSRPAVHRGGLKPRRFYGTYGAPEAAPLQNKVKT